MGRPCFFEKSFFAFSAKSVTFAVTMKKIFRILLITIVLLVVAVLYIKSKVHLVYLHDRPYQAERVITSEIVVDQKIETTMRYAMSETANRLEFAAKNDIANGKANCVGYARLAADICNDVFKQNNIKAKAKPVVGHYYVGSINIHDIVLKYITDDKTKNFWKDHDYVQILDLSNNVIGSFDPSVYDLTGFDFTE